jgi:putative hydrolase of the HAD superfamily
MKMIDLIAFDADDTLWQNESLYRDAQARFAQLLSPYQSPEVIAEIMNRIELDGLKYYGYGIKGFALSLIEAAIEISNGKISGREIETIIQIAKRMLTSKIQLMDGVEDTLTGLSRLYPLMIITKGDLFEQGTKISRSGIAHFFKYIEILSDKNYESYKTILAKYSINPTRFIMVGNSMRSDILPVIELGGRAIHVPYKDTWSHEAAEPPVGHQNFFEIGKLDLLPELINKISS